MAERWIAQEHMFEQGQLEQMVGSLGSQMARGE